MHLIVTTESLWLGTMGSLILLYATWFFSVWGLKPDAYSYL